MDQTSRNLRRRYLTTLDNYDWARWIAHKIRTRELDPDRVALMAYLKDERCKLVFSDFVLGNTFLYFGHALRNDEPTDIMEGIRRWGHGVTIMAACGIIRLLAERSYVRGPIWLGDVETVRSLAESYGPRRNRREKPTGLRKLVREKIPVPRGVTTLSQRMFQSMLDDIRFGRPYPGLEVIRITNGWTDDNCIMKGMRNGVRPWALGECA